MADKALGGEMKFFAHVRAGGAGGGGGGGGGDDNFHGLDEHLREVGRLAKMFATTFGAADLAELAGLWHDLGKYRPGFQRYIQLPAGNEAHIEGRVPGKDKTHSGAGALHAIERFGIAGRVLAYLIAGHHLSLIHI